MHAESAKDGCPLDRLLPPHRSSDSLQEDDDQVPWPAVDISIDLEQFEMNIHIAPDKVEAEPKNMTIY